MFDTGSFLLLAGSFGGIDIPFPSAVDDLVDVLGGPALVPRRRLPGLQEIANGALVILLFQFRVLILLGIFSLGQHLGACIRTVTLGDFLPLALCSSEKYAVEFAHVRLADTFHLGIVLWD